MKKLVVGQTVLYTLTAAEKKSYGYDVLPATVLFVYDDGSADLEVSGTGGELFLEKASADSFNVTQ